MVLCGSYDSSRSSHLFKGPCCDPHCCCCCCCWACKGSAARHLRRLQRAVCATPALLGPRAWVCCCEIIFFVSSAAMASIHACGCCWKAIPFVQLLPTSLTTEWSGAVRERACRRHARGRRARSAWFVWRLVCPCIAMPSTPYAFINYMQACLWFLVLGCLSTLG